MDTESDDTCSSTSPSPPPADRQPKRPSGRKKFRETRHPVYRGVRARAGGTRWVCEVREPQAQARIWLGTYPTPEMAARAHDVAAIALLGARRADLNFQDSAATLPRACTASPDDIRRTAAQAAELYRPALHRHQRSVRLRPPHLSLPDFVDEDAIFDMPALMDDMARGMLLTPPSMGMGRGLDDWSADDYVDDQYCRLADYCNLWMD